MQSEFGIEPEELAPSSTWFSYGSNLCRADFERKMRKYGSNLSLLCGVRTTLTGCERKLNNKSKTRGLAYSIGESRGSSVEGIMHDVPMADLPAFLRFEGIVNEDFSEIKRKSAAGECTGRRYDIKRVMVTVHESAPEIDCLTLTGCCLVPDREIESLINMNDNGKELVRYVKTAMKGAISFGIELEPFQQDLDVIRKFSGRNRS